MPRGSSGRRSGFTFLELALSMVVLLTAMGIFSSTVAGIGTQRSINTERNRAAQAARRAIEMMHNSDFDRVFALFNADPTDDPLGIGTAPGNRFAVPGLSPTPDSVDGLVGEVLLPTVDVGGGGGAPLLQELREDIVDPALGLPHDLNGDSIIDDSDHSGDYVILPVRIRIRWSGKTGVRELSTNSILCAYRRG